MRSLYACLAVMAIALSAAGISAAQSSLKRIDINSASREELKKLPGVNDQIAAQIMQRRPFHKPADLKDAGLSDSQIQLIQPLIVFGPASTEKPADRPAGPIASVPDAERGKRVSGFGKIIPGGNVAGVPVSHLCSSAWESEKPEEVVSPDSQRRDVTLCLPRTWFAYDGKLNETGKSNFSSLIERNRTEFPGEEITIVSLEPRSALAFNIRSSKSTRSVADYLGHSGYRTSISDQGGAPGTLKYDRELLERHSYSLQPLDELNPNRYGRKELILVVPPSRAQD